MEEELDFIMALKSLTSQKVDIPGVTSFFCQLYGFRTSNIVEVRYKAFMRMCSGREENSWHESKRYTLLPACTKTLSNHIKRAHYGARMWRRAVHINPTAEPSPTDSGWKLKLFATGLVPRKFCPGVTNLCIRQYERCIHR